MPPRSPTYDVAVTRDGVTIFEAPLRKRRCKAGKCKVMVSIGTPFCKTHLRARLGLEIRESALLESVGVHGLGVYATRPFRPNDVIAYYDCEHVTLQECARRYGKDNVHIYTLDDDRCDRTLADALVDRCVASLFNDAHGTRFENNIEFGPGSPSPVFALRDIEPGEELLIGYGSAYWRSYEDSRLVVTTSRRN